MEGRSQNALTGARIIVQKCLHLRQYDAFLLIYDESTRLFPSIFSAAAKECGVEFKKAFVSKRTQSTGEAFTPDLLREIERADGILVATTDDESCSRFRIELTTDKRGARPTVATMPGASLDLLANAIDIDYDQVARTCLDLTLPLVKGSRCVVSTRDRKGQSYELSFSLGGIKRPPIQSYGIIPRQAWGNVPAGETFVAPLEDSANGKIVINGAIGKERVTGHKEALLEFAEGRLVKHNYLATGGAVEYLLHIAEVARANQQEACWPVIAELGIGVNKHIRSITGVQLIDEKMYGTIHIAVGHNVGYGGRNQCQSVHCDMTTVRPTVTIDERKIIDRGEHCYDLKPFQDSFRSFKPPAQYAWSRKLRRGAVNEDSYVLEPGGRILVKKITGSGRQTVFPLGDEETTGYARALIGNVENGHTFELATLSQAIALDEDHLRSLLAILYMNGIVKPVP